ncbi:MlaD family protein [Paraconexibacter antarcticus]|uniref:MlaD family protein n=1 Tax=Paraconexibacter antarcticus TaxID=2949664 RepID=A0ABY5DZA2_9ACTN|nr:MlaD family protein [Paraconexibacter antarcticus]UTI66172.1 MlaD family protein [Paraconexibacter antarcticus]
MLAAIIVLAGSGKSAYTLKMRVATADGLVADQDVKIDGVRAGKVTAVKLARDDTAEITMQMDPSAAPVGLDARTRIRSVSVLGEKYIEMQPGHTDRPAPSGTWVKADAAAPVDLDDVLNTLDSGTRARLRIILAEGGTALTGRGDAVRRLLISLPNGMNQLGQVLDQATADTAGLKRVVNAGDRVISTLTPRRHELGQLVQEADGALQATADRRAALGAAVGQAPSALAQLRRSLGLLEQASTNLQPAADQLRRSAAPIGSTLKALPQFSRDATPTLDKARAAAPDLAKLARGVQPTLRKLQPVAKKLHATLAQADPLVQGLDKGLADDALYFLQTWARVTARSDGLSHLFGAQITITEDTVRMITDRVLSGSNANDPPQQRKNGRPQAPASSPTSTPQSLIPKPKLPAVKPLVCKALGDVTKGVNGVLGQLTGGKRPPAALPGGGACNGQPPAPKPTPKKALGDAVSGLLSGAKHGAAPDPKAPDGATSGSDIPALLDYLFGS